MCEDDIIEVCKNMLARHEIPDIVRKDNLPEFSIKP